MVVTAIIEMPTDSKYKYEIKEGKLILDRVLNQPIPVNYGYVPDTLAADGDPDDIFVMSQEPLVPGCSVHAVPKLVLICEDQGVSDDKIIATLVGDPISPAVYSARLYDIIQYLSSYKDGFRVIDQVTFEEWRRHEQS